MNEKIYKTMSITGAGNIALGVVAINGAALPAEFWQL